jgi:hypothetical protein
MDKLTKFLSKAAPFQGDLDYHLIRIQMVIIYFFFGYQKWFDYEMQGLIPFFTHGPLIFWMYPVFGMKGSTYLGCLRVVVRRVDLGGLLEQEAGSPGSPGVGDDVYHDGHDHPVYARWLGFFGGRISCDGGECCLPDERRSAAGRVVLSAEAGCSESVGSY